LLLSIDESLEELLAKRRNWTSRGILKGLKRDVELGYFIKPEKDLPVLGK
jgi:hypothetical protein